MHQHPRKVSFLFLITVVNISFSYHCDRNEQLCKAGFSFDPRTTQCIDIDECEDKISPCRIHEKCVNNIGSYACIPDCAPGMEWNGRSCRGNLANLFNSLDSLMLKISMNVIQMLMNAGSTACVWIDRGAIVVTVIKDSKNKRSDSSAIHVKVYFIYIHCFFACLHLCLLILTHFIDINECERKNSPCQYNCQNTIGGYDCTCPSGYRLNRNRCEGRKTVDLLS